LTAFVPAITRGLFYLFDLFYRRLARRVYLFGRLPGGSNSDI